MFVFLVFYVIFLLLCHHLATDAIVSGLFILDYNCRFLYEKFEDIKEVIRGRNSKKDGQYNDQMKKEKELSAKHYTES
jgi:hypothetical protein